MHHIHYSTDILYIKLFRNCIFFKWQHVHNLLHIKSSTLIPQIHKLCKCNKAITRSETFKRQILAIPITLKPCGCTLKIKFVICSFVGILSSSFCTLLSLCAFLSFLKFISYLLQNKDLYTILLFVEAQHQQTKKINWECTYSRVKHITKQTDKCVCAQLCITCTYTYSTCVNVLNKNLDHNTNV